jgi:hypothetical protein
MAQTYTLEEAVQKLGIPKAEFQRRLNDDLRHIRPMRDGATLRFRAHDIDELARTMGQASEPELILADSSYEVHATPTPPKPAVPPETTKTKAPAPAADDPLILDLDDVQLAPPGATAQPTPSQSPKTVPLPKGAAKPSDDDPLVLDDQFEVSLEPPPPSSGSPRTAKLPNQPARPANVVDLELDEPLAASGKGPGSSGRLNKSGKPKAPGGESPLVLDDEDVDLGAPQRDVTGRGPDSGINLRNPQDSGISLEAPSEDEFELNLDSVSGTIKPVGGPKSGKNLLADSDSEFELNLDDLGGSAELELEPAKPQKDIFETNFDVPKLDESGSEVVPLEESTIEADSDFDLDLAVSDAEVEIEEVDDSTSVAVPVKPKPAAGKKGKAAAAELEEVRFDEDLDESMSASKALRGAQIEDDELEEVEDEPTTVAAAEAKPASWGVLPLVLMFPCVITVVLAGLMGFELVRGQWGYTQSYRPTSFITRTVADTFKDVVGYDVPKE